MTRSVCDKPAEKRRITGNLAKVFLVNGAANCDTPSDFSYLYVIQCGTCGPIKLGFAGNPVWRLGDLQCGSWEELHLRAVVAVLDGDHAAIERMAHSLASAKRIRGEWFSLEPLDAVACVMRAAHELGHLIGTIDDARQQRKEIMLAELDASERERVRILRQKLGIDL